MPNTLTTIFTSTPASEPVESPHPNTGVYTTGTQLGNGTWQVVHTLVTKTSTPPTITGRLKNFPAITATVVASGNVLNNILATPTGTSAVASSATAINATVSSNPNATAYRLLSATTAGGTYSQIYQGAAAGFAHTGLTASTTYYYEWQYVGGGYYDDSALSAVFNGATTTATTIADYAVPDQWADDFSSRADPSGNGRQHNAYASLVVNVPAGKQLLLPFASTMAAQFNGNTLGVVVNGVETTIALAATSTQEVSVPGLSASSANVVKIFAPAPVRPGGTGAIISDNLLRVRSDGTVTFGAAPTGTYVITIFGDSITCGGNSTTPVFQGYAPLLRKLYAQLGPDVRIVLRSASADSLTAQYDTDATTKAAFIQELGAGLKGVNGNTLLLAIGTNDKGLKSRTDADFLALYAALVDAFHAAFPTVLVVALPPLTRTDGVDVSGYLSGILGLRATRSQWLEVLDPAAMLPAGQGYLSADGLHPTTQGHQVLAANLFDGLRNHRGAYVPPPTGNGVFLEEFDAPSRNTALWNEGYMGYVGPGVTMSQTNSSLQFTATYGNGHQTGYTSIASYDMSGGRSFAGKILSLFSPVDQAVMNLVIGLPGGDYNKTAGMTLQNRTIAFSGFNFLLLASIPYNPSLHVYWRLREASGHLLMQTSADNNTWTTRYDYAAPPLPLSAVKLVVSAGASADAPAGVTETSIGTAAWDWVRFVNPASAGSSVTHVEDTAGSVSYPDGSSAGTNAAASNGTFVTSHGRVLCSQPWTGGSIKITYVTDTDYTFTQPIEVYVDGALVGQYNAHTTTPGAVAFGVSATFAVTSGNHNGFELRVQGNVTDQAKANYFDCADFS